MKKIILLIVVIVILVIIGIFTINNNSNNSEETLQQGNIENKENKITTLNEYIREGSEEHRGFILDNTLITTNSEIHFNIHYPENYDKAKQYAIYFANPGWEGLYFQGVGKDLGEPYVYEAQKYNKDMIIKSKVYISGLSGGGETLSIVLGKRPELFTSALYISSQWDGNLDTLSKAKTPLYMVIGENDSYYGSTKTRNAYNSLHKLYKEQGMSDEEIDKILVLDVKEHEYFTLKGYSDEHAGCGLFAYEENIMNWIFSKSK